MRLTLLGGSGGESFTVLIREGGNGFLLSRGGFCSGFGLFSRLRLLGVSLGLLSSWLGLLLRGVGLALLNGGRVDLDLLGHYIVLWDRRSYMCVFLERCLIGFVDFECNIKK